MDAATNTSTRAKNFSKKEKSLFRALLLKYPVLTGTATAKYGKRNTVAKNRAWDDLAAEFNGQNHNCERTSKQLRKLWENLKAADNKQQRFQTEGGKKTTSDATNQDLDMKRLFENANNELHGTKDGNTAVHFTSVTQLSEVPAVPSSSGASTSINCKVQNVKTNDDSVSDSAKNFKKIAPFGNGGLSEEKENFSSKMKTASQKRSATIFNEATHKSRKALYKELVEERKKMMRLEETRKAKEHTWKETEHKLRLEVLKARKEATKAKASYYTSRNVDQLLQTMLFLLIRLNFNQHQ